MGPDRADVLLARAGGDGPGAGRPRAGLGGAHEPAGPGEGRVAVAARTRCPGATSRAGCARRPRPPAAASRAACAGRPRAASRSAVSAAAPNRSTRPPKAIAQTLNHAPPSASPASTSLSQWTESSTRLPATSTISPRPRRRRSRSARPRPAAGEQQRRRAPEGHRPRRVAARERRPERRGDRVELRADAIGELLDRRRQQPVARPRRRATNGTTQRERVRIVSSIASTTARRDHDPRLAEMRHRVEAPARGRRSPGRSAHVATLRSICTSSPSRRTR